MRIFDPKLTGSIQFLNPVIGAGITASLFGSASYALTASYALNGGVGGGSNPGGSDGQLQYRVNSTTFGGVSTATFDGTNLRATGSFSGSFSGTASFSTTASFALNGGVTSLLGTTNEILVNGTTTAQTGQITLSLPSSVDLGVVSSFTATSLTGSITASSLQGAILNTQLQNSSVTVGSTNIALGATSTTLNGLTQVSTTGITGSILSTNGVVSASSFTSPSQGTLRATINGTQTDVDLALQTGDDVTFNKVTATNGLTGSLTASSLIGDIRLGTQTSGDYVSSITAGNGLASTGATTGENISHTLSVNAGAGISVTAPTSDAVNLDTGSVHFLDGVKKELNTETVLSGSVSSPSQGTISVGGFTNIDLGLQSGDDVTFNKVTVTNGLTGSITASSLQGAILNTQLQNSSVTVGNTNISLGGTATTITGLTSITSTNFVGTASYVTGSIFTSTNPALSASFALTASYALNAGVSSGGGNSFATFSVAGQDDVIAEVSSDTLTLVAGTNISITTNAGADSITINSTAAGGGGNSFATFSVAGQNNVIAEIENDTLTLAAGSGISITTNETTDTITITKISDFPYTGSAIISGSLIVTGSARILADGRDGFESFGNVNDYFEIFAQNLNSGISASSDIVAYNDQGTKTQNYVDMGINSTGISSTYSFGKANDAYVYNTGGDLFIGNSTAFYQPTRTSQSLHLFANAPGIPDLTITGSRIGIQKSSSLNAALDVIGNVMISGALHITGSAAAELKVLGDSEFTGSVKVTNGIIAQSVTASLQGSASYALTASFALNAGGGSGFPFAGEAVITGSILLSTGSAFFPILTASEALTAGDFVNISTGGVRKASNNDITKLAHGYVIEGYSATQPVKVFYDGINPANTGLSIGSRYFLGTSGAETLTPPTAAGSLSQEIGVAVSTTAILVNFKSAIVT